MERLHPRVRFVWLSVVLLLAVVAGAVSAVAQYRFTGDWWVGVAVAVVVAGVGATYTVLRYRAWRFEVQADALFIERGVLTRITTVAPFVRVQHVDSQRGPIARLAGLAEVVVYTAGSRGADVSIPGLTPDRATALRERLRELAIESESEDAV